MFRGLSKAIRAPGGAHLRHMNTSAQRIGSPSTRALLAVSGVAITSSLWYYSDSLAASSLLANREAVLEAMEARKTNSTPTEAPKAEPVAVEEPAEAAPTKDAPTKEEESAVTGKEETSDEGHISEKYREYKYVIVGGGTAAYNALLRIQKKDPSARILWICGEDESAYMRPPLSKELWTEAADAEGLTFKDWRGKPSSLYYPALQLENMDIKRGVQASRLHPDYKALFLDNGELVYYEKCLLATGGTPKTLGDAVMMNAKESVSTFRNVDDFKKLHAMALTPNTNIVVLGAGFLGSELAAGLAMKMKEGVRVSLVFPEEGLLSRVLPSYLSNRLRQYMETLGIDIYPSTLVTQIEREGEKLKLVNSQGLAIEADHVVFCGGLQPNGEIAEKSGLEVDAEGGITVDSEMQTTRSHIYAAGDVASFYDPTLRSRRRIEHYNSAVMSGSIAGENMTGGTLALKEQSTYWSDLPHVSLEALGITDPALENVGIWLDDDQDKDKGLVYYLKDDKVVGVLAWNLSGKMDEARRILARGKQVHNREDLRGWISLQD